MKLTYHKRIVKFLSDGQWHTLREIVNAVGRHIDAEIADVEYRRRRRGWASTPQRDRIAAGKKRLVFLSLNSMHHHRGMIEVKGTGNDWDRQYRATKATVKRFKAATV